jgi:glycosyltransferase involved in cell wall biosynthesis
LGKADHVVTVTKAAALVLQASGIPQQRMRVISSGVDTEWFSQSNHRDGRACWGISPDSLVIGCLANVLAIKGQDLLIEAFSKVTRAFPAACCLFVGREDGSPYGLEVRARVSRLGLSDKIHFAGFQSDVRLCLSAMDCVALTSRSEGLPIALLEAMAMGKPVVATRVGGIPEVVEDGVTGLLVPPDNPDSIAGALQALLGDPARRQQMGRAGRRRVLEQFDLNSSVEAFQQLYEHLLAGEGR